MDIYAIIVFIMGVALGFLRRGKEERAKTLEVLLISMFLSLISAVASLVESCENSESHWLSRFSRDNDEKEQNEAVYEGFKLGKDFDADIVVRCTGVKGVVGEDEIRKISKGSIL